VAIEIQKLGFVIVNAAIRGQHFWGGRVGGLAITRTGQSDSRTARLALIL
jgi:hypothetical protein